MYVIYVVADTLRVARINTVSCEWYMFREHVSTEAGRHISKNEIAALVNHGPYTIKRALGETGQAPPKNMKVLASLEAFMAKMYMEKFGSLGARLALVSRKRKKDHRRGGR